MKSKYLRGNNMATKTWIAHILRIIQIMWIPQAKLLKQFCLKQALWERVGIIIKAPQPRTNGGIAGLAIVL